MPNHRITIYRKGNGGSYVDPSPETVRNGDVIRFWNITECAAELKFKTSIFAEKAPYAIGPDAYLDLTVQSSPPTPKYHEYKAELTCKEARATQYAEGGSDPGLVVDP